MRRFGVFVFIIVFSFAVFKSNSLLGNYEKELNNIEISYSGVVTSIEEKEFSSILILDRSVYVNVKKSRGFIGNKKLSVTNKTKGSKHNTSMTSANFSDFNRDMKGNNFDYESIPILNVSIGDKVCVKGVEKSLYSLEVKGFKYGKMLLSKGYDCYIDAKKIDIIGSSWIYSLVGKVRSFIIDGNFFMYNNYAGILNAMTVGDRSGLTKQEEFLFLDSGTSHLMAISGLHIAIICSIIMLFFGKINNIYRLGLVYAVLSFYSLIVSNTPSVERAINLMFLSYIAIFIDERVDIINIISLLASIMILKNIFIIYNISFELSFLTVASMSIYKKYIDKYICFDFISITLSSMILTLPLIFYYFGEVSMMGFFGNLLVIPFIGFIILGDIVSIILYYLDCVLYVIVQRLVGWMMSFILFIMEKVGGYGVNNIIYKDMPFKLVVIYYILVLFVSIYIYLNKIRENKLCDDY